MRPLNGNNNPQATMLRVAGLILPVVIGATLWPRLIEWGVPYENSNFGLALILVWFCIPITLCVAMGVSWFCMKTAASMDGNQSATYDWYFKATLLGVTATLGSCGMIAMGIEPPTALHGIYDINPWQR